MSTIRGGKVWSWPFCGFDGCIRPVKFAGERCWKHATPPVVRDRERNFFVSVVFAAVVAFGLMLYLAM